MAAAAKKKKSSGTKTVYKTVQAKKKKKSNPSGVKDIPAASMTVGIIAANAAPIRTAISQMSIDGVKQAATAAIQPEQLKKTAAYAIGGAMIGYGIKQFAPKFIKKPMGLVAKKIKGVF